MINSWIDTLQTLGITLLHSLWQGLILAVMAATMLLLTPKAHPNLRYRFLVGLLALFTLGVSLTFIQQLRSPALALRLTQVAIPIKPVGEAQCLGLCELGVKLRSGLSVVMPHLSSLVLVWLAMVVYKSLQLLKGLFQLRALSHHKTWEVEPQWQNRLRALARQVGIRQPVQLLQSGRVKSPLVLGFLKPAILIPLGSLTAIPPAQIELMLLHELAHLKRLDFLVNLVQHLLEVLFFFNPALLWLSAQIRVEREACCDALVLAHTGNKRGYIQTLLAFRQFELDTADYGLAFAHQKGLISRVERIISSTNPPLAVSEKVLLALSILLIIISSLLYAQADDNLLASSSKAPSSHYVKRRPDSYRIRPNTDYRDKSTVAARQSDGPRESGGDTSTKGNLKAVRTTFRRLPKRVATASKRRWNPVARGGALKPVIDSGLQSAPNPSRLLLALPVEKSVPEQVIDAVIMAGLYPVREGLSFHITNAFLVVNGTPQSQQVHQRILSKFVKKPGDILDFTYVNTRPVAPR